MFYAHQIVTSDIAEEEEADVHNDTGHITAEGNNSDVKHEPESSPPEIHQIDESYGMQMATVLLNEIWCIWVS